MNECPKEREIFIAAEGLGGHQSGEKASEIAVETAEENLRKFLEREEKKRPLKKASPEVTPSISVDTKNLKKAISEAIQQANQKVMEAAQRDVSSYAMGCALLVAVVRGKRLVIGHAGDIRTYLVRNNKIKLLTQDHTLAAELVRIGKLSEEEARIHYLRHRLTRVMGLEDEVIVDLNSASLNPKTN